MKCPLLTSKIKIHEALDGIKTISGGDQGARQLNKSILQQMLNDAKNSRPAVANGPHAQPQQAARPLQPVQQQAASRQSQAVQQSVRNSDLQPVQRPAQVQQPAQQTFQQLAVPTVQEEVSGDDESEDETSEGEASVDEVSGDEASGDEASGDEASGSDESGSESSGSESGKDVMMEILRR